MTYSLVSAVSPDELVSKVSELLNKGWEPQGGVSVATFTTDKGPQSGLYQAMVQR